MTDTPGDPTVDLVRREVALGVPGLALVAAGGLVAQAQRAAHAPLPRFPDLDPSGRYGADGTDPVRVVILGDSTLTGPGLEHGSQVWIAQAAQRLPWPVELRCHARGGTRVDGVLRHQLGPATSTAADLFVVAVGANDAVHGTPARRFAGGLAELVDSLRAHAPVLTLGVGDMSMIPRIPAGLRPLLSRRCRTIDRAHAEVCARRDAVHRIPVAEVSDPHFRAHGRAVFGADLFHPNATGHALWAELFRPWLHVTLHRHLTATAEAVAPGRPAHLELRERTW